MIYVSFQNINKRLFLVFLKRFYLFWVNWEMIFFLYFNFRNIIVKDIDIRIKADYFLRKFFYLFRKKFEASLICVSNMSGVLKDDHGETAKKICRFHQINPFPIRSISLGIQWFKKKCYRNHFRNHRVKFPWAAYLTRTVNGVFDFSESNLNFN